MIWKSPMIFFSPLIVGVLLMECFHCVWVIPGSFLIAGILFIAFRNPLGGLFYRDSELVKQMSKKVTWSILKGHSGRFGKEKDEMINFKKQAANMGLQFIFMALIFAFFLWIYIRE